MPDGQNPKSPKAPIVKYKGAEKVTYDPTTKGFKKQETIDNKTYYDKEAAKAIPGGIGGDAWKQTIIKQLNSGVSPQELVDKGHISKESIPEFTQYYKPVYTEPTVTVPKTTIVDPAIGQRSAFKLETPLTADQTYNEYTIPDPNGQVNASKKVYTDKQGNVYKDFLSGKTDLSGETIDDIRKTSFRSDAQGSTNLPTQINGVPVTGNTAGYVDPLLMKEKGDKAGTVLSSTGGGYKNGGLVKKIRKYADGGSVEPEFNQYQTTNPLLSSAATTGLNSFIPGAGTAVGIGLQGKDALTNQFTQVDPTTGKYKSKTNAYGGGLIDAAFKATPLGMAQTALDPNKDLGEKALSIGTLGIADLIKSKRGTDNMEQSNIDIVAANKLKEEQDRKNALAQQSLSKQLVDRSQGLKNGGKVEGRGTAKSDSITAKVKEDSFIVPAENAAKAELVRKVVLKAPIVKANLKQQGGEKVKLSDGEHLFTPKEKAIIESKGVNLEALAPNAKKELPGDKQQLANQKELLGFKDGGSLADSLKSGNKTTAKKKSVPTYYAKKKEVISPDYLNRIDNTLDTSNEDVEASLSQDAGTNNMGERTAPLPSNQPSVNSAPKTGLAGKFSMGDVSKAIEMGIPLAQIGFGLSQLKKQGKRPVDELDKNYLDTIQKARTGVDIANANAKYGFTPEEAALLNQENQNLTNAQRYTARNLGGGAGNAYNMERNAINNSFGRGLRAKVENANLKLQKQGIAQDKQAYLDSLIGNKTEMSRRLFNDKMNAFNTNQTAGGNLVGAGIKNLVSGNRYNAELAAMKNTANLENDWMKSI